MNFTRIFSYFITRMYPYVTRMLVVCLRMYPYVSYVTRMLPVCYPMYSCGVLVMIAEKRVKSQYRHISILLKPCGKIVSSSIWNWITIFFFSSGRLFTQGVHFTKLLPEELFYVRNVHYHKFDF